MSSNKFEKTICKIQDFSKESLMKDKHGSVIMKGKKIVCSGINNHRTSYYDNIMCSTHAEIDSLIKLIKHLKLYNIRKDKIRRKIKKFILVTCKDSFNDSKPCYDCLHQIKAVGIKKIVYVENNTIIQHKICSESNNRRTIINVHHTKNIKISNLL